MTSPTLRSLFTALGHMPICLNDARKSAPIGALLLIHSFACPVATESVQVWYRGSVHCALHSFSDGGFPRSFPRRAKNDGKEPIWYYLRVSQVTISEQE